MSRKYQQDWFIDNISLTFYYHYFADLQNVIIDAINTVKRQIRL